MKIMSVCPAFITNTSEYLTIFKTCILNSITMRQGSAEILNWKWRTKAEVYRYELCSVVVWLQQGYKAKCLKLSIIRSSQCSFLPCQTDSVTTVHGKLNSIQNAKRLMADC